MGRALILGGLILLVMGLLVTFGGNFLNRIPGNFELRGKNWVIYFPFGLCLLISLIGTLLSWLLNRR
jgi:hypothetical protein